MSDSQRPVYIAHILLLQLSVTTVLESDSRRSHQKSNTAHTVAAIVTAVGDNRLRGVDHWCGHGPLQNYTWVGPNVQVFNGPVQKLLTMKPGLFFDTFIWKIISKSLPPNVFLKLKNTFASGVLLRTPLRAYHVRRVRGRTVSILLTKILTLLLQSSGQIDASRIGYTVYAKHALLMHSV